MQEHAIVFDDTAVGFASVADAQIHSGSYIRGDVFVGAASSAVPPNGLVLDYGCGPGRISVLLARRGFSVLGVDPSQPMIATAKQQPLDELDVKFQLCPNCPDDVPRGPYDAIVCSSVIEYVPDADRLLDWFHAALRPSGLLIISFANNRSLWRAWVDLRHSTTYLGAQRHTWSWRQFRGLLGRGGFTPVRRPTYFESPHGGSRHLRALCSSSLVGILGLVVVRKCEAP